MLRGLCRRRSIFPCVSLFRQFSSHINSYVLPKVCSIRSLPTLSHWLKSPYRNYVMEDMSIDALIQICGNEIEFEKLPEGSLYDLAYRKRGNKSFKLLQIKSTASVIYKKVYFQKVFNKPYYHGWIVGIAFQPTNGTLQFFKSYIFRQQDHIGKSHKISCTINNDDQNSKGKPMPLPGECLKQKLLSCTYDENQYALEVAQKAFLFSEECSYEWDLHNLIQPLLKHTFTYERFPISHTHIDATLRFQDGSTMTIQEKSSRFAKGQLGQLVSTIKGENDIDLLIIGARDTKITSETWTKLTNRIGGSSTAKYLNENMPIRYIGVIDFQNCLSMNLSWSYYYPPNTPPNKRGGRVKRPREVWLDLKWDYAKKAQKMKELESTLIFWSSNR